MLTSEQVEEIKIETLNPINEGGRIYTHSTLRSIIDNLCQSHLEALERVRELEDWADLMCDEFKRIHSCPGSDDEIKGLCDRAITNTHQRVHVITQRDKAFEDAHQAILEKWRLEARVRELEGRGEAMTTEREMSLKEWCERLPNFHRVNKELHQLLQERERLEGALKQSLNQVHNNDCLFCGSKDKIAKQALGVKDE